MTALIIIGSIVLIFAVLLSIPICVYVSYIGGKLEYSVKYLWITLFPRPEKPQKEEPPEETPSEESTPAQTDAAESEAAEDEPEETPLTAEEKRLERERKKREQQEKNEENKRKLKMLISLLKNSGHGVRRLVKGIKFRKVALDFDVADEDAARAAINYGLVNIATYDTLGFLRVFFTVSFDHVNISCKFNSKDSRYDGSFVLKVSPGCLIAVLVSIGGRFWFAWKKDEKEKAAQAAAEKEVANTRQKKEILT